MDYQNKYLKYKNKYFQLKQYIQFGGNNQKEIKDLLQIKIFFRTMLNNNIISGDTILKTISGKFSKPLKEIDPNTITYIKINKYDNLSPSFFQLFFTDPTNKYSIGDEQFNDPYKLTIYQNDSNSLYKELQNAWDFI